MNQDDSQMSMLQRIAAQTKPAPVVNKPTAEPVKQAAEPVDPLAWVIPGFGAGARVETSFGHVPVEALRRRDPIRTKSGRFLKVQYVDAIRLERRFLLTHPEAQPITIPKNAFGPSSPNQNIQLSGAQKIKMPGRFDQSQTKVVEDLIGQRFIVRNLTGYFTYYVFHCGEPCLACIDGLWVDIDPTTPDVSTN